jgi:hypothetical protein
MAKSQGPSVCITYRNSFLPSKTVISLFIDELAADLGQPIPRDAGVVFGALITRRAVFVGYDRERRQWRRLH